MYEREESEHEPKPKRMREKRKKGGRVRGCEGERGEI